MEEKSGSHLLLEKRISSSRSHLEKKEETVKRMYDKREFKKERLTRWTRSSRKRDDSRLRVKKRNRGSFLFLFADILRDKEDRYKLTILALCAKIDKIKLI